MILMNKLYKRLLALLGIGIWIALTAPGVKAEETTAAAAPPNPLIELLDSETSIYEYDIPDDILKNLVTAPNALKRPGSVVTSTSSGKTSSAPTVKKKVTPGKMDGYRVQVFSDGRNPQTLQTRAKARGNAIVAKFPKYRGQIYSFSSSPNWYTRVGNFRTQAEASAALAELRRAFPAFAAEMRVVKSVITAIQ